MTDLTIANTILSQLGGRRVAAMIGVSTFVGSDDALSFRFKAKALKGINHVEIKLDPSDTYTVTFRKIRGTDVKEIAKISDVYCDTLRGVIESTTGLYLSL